MNLEFIYILDSEVYSLKPGVYIMKPGIYTYWYLEYVHILELGVHDCFEIIF